jgi:alkane 1-monooxygenase
LRQDEVSSGSIGFIEKYAIQYYTTTLLYVAFHAINYYMQKPFYFFAFIVLFPFLGKLMPKDDMQITNAKYHNKNIYHALPLASCVIANFLTIAYLCLHFPYLQYTGIEYFMAVFSTVLLITPSIDASHELIHRPEFFFRVIGFLNMTVFWFNVYPIEHLYLHHKYVGTEKDPITSKKNYSLFFYIIRAYFSAHKFVFQYSKLIFLGCVALNLAYLSAIYLHGVSEYGSYELAWDKLHFFIWLGFGGFIGLEIIEYIEHYGLIFREDIDKKAINELSSWNTDGNIIHNWMIFRFQRHSDHHMNAYKYFSTLELNDKMPKFPITFNEGLYLSFISPLWYYLMNPFVAEQLENKKVDPSHIKFVYFIRQLVFIVVIGVCAYFYHLTVSQPALPL